MTPSQKIKEFKDVVYNEVKEQVNRLDIQSESHIETLKNVSFETFSCERPYNGEIKNKVFFTYNDHYKDNLGTWMDVNEFYGLPHTEPEDRGYIKGVVTDLDGLCSLKKANSICYNIDVVLDIYCPTFSKSKHSDSYNEECDSLKKQAIEALESYRAEKIGEINAYLKEATGCSLLHYLREF